MDLTQSPEQQALKDTVRRLVRDELPAERMAQLADAASPLDQQLWDGVQQLGVCGLLVPEEHGGVGATWAEAAVVVAELGRRLACVPFLASSLVATTILREADQPSVASELLEQVASGGIVVSARAGRSGEICPEAVEVTATHADGEWRLDGIAAHVEHGTAAATLLVLARNQDEDLGWYVVDADAERLTVEPMRVLDATRPRALVRFDGAPAQRLPLRHDAWEVAERAIDAEVTGLACEARAACEHLLGLTIEHAKDRVQFGQPIGSFQAVQHRCADLAVLVDEATSAAAYAVWAAAERPDRWREAAAMAAAVTAEAYLTLAQETIQVHGGIGFTWEHPAHRYFRRSQTSALAAGSASQHRERLLTEIGLPREVGSPTPGPEPHADEAAA